MRGNHEDFAWLAQLSRHREAGTVAVDPFDWFRYVPDGTVLDLAGLRVAFLGGVEERTDQAAIDRAAYQTLLALEAGAADLLVTHQGPYGSSIGHRGDIHGSQLITDLLAGLQPPFQVAGHAHTLSGPAEYEQTMYLGLDCLVASPIWQPEAQGFQPGCLAVFDTEQGRLWPVDEPWLADFKTLPFDFWAWFQTFDRSG